MSAPTQSLAGVTLVVVGLVLVVVGLTMVVGYLLDVSRARGRRMDALERRLRTLEAMHVPAGTRTTPGAATSRTTHRGERC